jgi:hypothetical protein
LALKDTLKMLREREQRDKQALEDKPKVIQEWKEALATLFAKIRGYLEEYEKDGSLSFSEETTRLTEVSVFKCFRTICGVWNGGSGSFG